MSHAGWLAGWLSLHEVWPSSPHRHRDRKTQRDVRGVTAAAELAVETLEESLRHTHRQRRMQLQPPWIACSHVQSLNPPIPLWVEEERRGAVVGLWAGDCIPEVLYTLPSPS